MSIWRLGHSTQLTLKQLGYSDKQISQAVDKYQTEPGPKGDDDFFNKFPKLITTSQDHIDQLKHSVKLSPQWEPSRKTKEALYAKGYTAEAVSYYRDIFIISTIENESLIYSPDEAFTSYCLGKKPSLPKPLPSDWLPSQKTVQDILETVCPDIAYITDKLPKFIDTYAENEHHNWEKQFKEYVNRGWNVLRDK